MAVVIYRQGNTHTVNGIQCEAKRVSHRLFEGEPEPGWFLSPEDAYKEIDDGLQKETQTEQKEEQDEKEKIIESALKKEAGWWHVKFFDIDKVYKVRGADDESEAIELAISKLKVDD